MRLILMGAPGSGKGTQGALLAQRLGVPAISTGDIFRANVAARTRLGGQAQGYLDGGEYVPDEITNAMVRGRLAEPDTAGGFVLDGYPRTVSQIAYLDEVLRDAGTALDAVLWFSVEQDEVVRRLLERARVEGRADDTAEVIRRRQEIFLAQTAPLMGEYRYRGLLVKVDGAGTVGAIAQRVAGALARSGRAPV
ncbi:MAG: adenylate kinase [Nocardioidaceae bacterium]|nr:adenylate kinase [Nocardioidaceae bacterium]